MGSGLPDLPSWWSEPGRPGYAPETWDGADFPWTLAGLVRGAWALEEPGRAPPTLPFPGPGAIHSALACYDSIAVETGGMGAWRGFDAALGTARGLPAAAQGQRARTLFSLANGTAGLEDNALAIERGDSLSWLRGEALSAKRGELGALGLMGRHRWGAAGAVTRGHHRLTGTYAQRGAAAALAASTAEQATRGESGELAYRYRSGARWASLALARGHDRHESFGLLVTDSRREAQEVMAVAEAGSAGPRGNLAARLEWGRAAVQRFGPRPADLRPGWVWGAVRAERALGDGELSAALGAGRHGGVGGVQAAPSLAYAFGEGVFRGRVLLERQVTPVWSDLAFGQAPFLQNAWIGGLEASAAGRSALARASYCVGRVSGRAVAVRWPLEEIWLRSGLLADPERYAFGLFTAALSWRGGPMGLGLEGFALGRDENAVQPRVDPGAGFRGFAEGRVRLFAGDLGVRLRAEVEGVGERQSENDPVRRLPGYAIYGASAEFSLLDARVTLRVRNLGDRRVPETWVDPLTGVEALGPGRELRLAVSGRLLN